MVGFTDLKGTFGENLVYDQSLADPLTGGLQVSGEVGISGSVGMVAGHEKVCKVAIEGEASTKMILGGQTKPEGRVLKGGLTFDVKPLTIKFKASIESDKLPIQCEWHFGDSWEATPLIDLEKESELLDFADIGNSPEA